MCILVFSVVWKWICSCWIKIWLRPDMSHVSFTLGCLLRNHTWYLGFSRCVKILKCTDCTSYYTYNLKYTKRRKQVVFKKRQNTHNKGRNILNYFLSKLVDTKVFTKLFKSEILHQETISSKHNFSKSFWELIF